MERIEILQGTNPTIAVKLKGVELIPSFEQTVDGDTVKRCSYFTIRHTDGSYRPIDPKLGELQIEMNEDTGSADSWEETDDYGNVFTIARHVDSVDDEHSIAQVELSRSFTRLLHAHDYYIQFNLIDNNEKMFAVDDKPILMRVGTNLADLRDNDENS